MSVNLGTVDRTLRIIIGVAILASAWMTLSGVWLWAAFAIGAVLMVTAVVGICPAYSLLGVSTCPHRLKGIRSPYK